MLDSSVDFSSAEIAFCDSRVALDAAYARGLPRDAVVRTLAPAIALDPAIPCRPLASNLSFERRQQLSWWADSVCRELNGTIDGGRDNPLTRVAGLVLTFHQNALFRAACLEPEDFGSHIAVVEAVTGNARTDRQTRAPWLFLFSEHAKIVHAEIPVDGPDLQATPASPKLGDRLASLWRRRHLGIAAQVAYPLALRVSPYVPSPSRKGTVLVLSENSLLRETAADLFRRGFRLRKLTPPTLVPVEDSAELAPFLATCDEVIGSHLDDNVTESARGPFRRFLLARIAEEAESYLAAMQAWPRVLDSHEPASPRAVLDAYPKGGVSIALHELSRRRNRPVVAFQHGISREFTSAPEASQAAAENAIADLFICYNAQCKAVADANPHRIGTTYAAGLPHDYWRAGLSGGRRRTIDILYVSTNLYAGNIQHLRGGGMADPELAQFETALVRDVLGALPHEVVYKAYPALRYLDPDPALVEARRQANISVYDDGLNMRFFMPRSRVLVTSRATSTLGWCLMSDLPLVYLDIPHSLPLREEARRLLEPAVFFVDGRRDDYPAVMRELLSRPLASLEADWAARRGAREAARDALLQAGGPGAGRRGAAVVQRAIAGRGP